jgi:sugar phosphate isomerase/epimerase
VTAQLTDAAQLGAEFAYVVPCRAADELDAFTDSCRLLAMAAGRRMMRLCVEPMPGTVLASAATTLDWLQQPGLEQVGLLLDVGHCLISKEDPAEMIRRAGQRLGYVHFDDNDGSGDLHWPLLTGRLTEAALHAVMTELRRTAFAGGMALELSAKLPEPIENLQASKTIVMKHGGVS